MAVSLRMLVWHWQELGLRARLFRILLVMAALVGPPLLDGLLDGALDPRPYAGIVVLSVVMAGLMELESRRIARHRRLRPLNGGSAGAP